MPNPAIIIFRFFRPLAGSGGAALLAAILLIAVSCAEAPIAERGSRADRVFDLANEGDSTAQTALGLLYERGLGVPRDSALALVWYRRAAAQGEALAEFHIGSLYERGSGVGRDYTEAATWYRRASEKGNESAQAALAYLYDRGLGVERDFGEAAALYSQASASWAETDTYPAEATFATGREGPALASPGISAIAVGEQRPEFSAGKEEAPAIEIDLSALDDVPDPPPGATVFDGPQPIAGRGENFPLASSSLTPPEQARVPEPREAQLEATDRQTGQPPLPPSPKPGQAARLLADENSATPENMPVSEDADGGVLIAAQPEPERVVLSVKALLEDEGAAITLEAPSTPKSEPPPPPDAAPAPLPKSKPAVIEAEAKQPEPAPQPAPVADSDAAASEAPQPPPEPAPAPVAESQTPVKEAKMSAAEEQQAIFQLGEAEEKLIATLEAELDQEAAAFDAVLEAAEEDAGVDVLEPLPPEPEIFLISLATFETEALAKAEWAKIRKTHAGLVGRLPHELQPIDTGGDERFFELIVGPLDSPLQSRALCGALRAHGHVCRTIDK